MNCLTCKFAEWERTAAGRLHPSGDGRCAWECPTVTLPSCMYWIGRSFPQPTGGYINRKRLHENCPCYMEKGGAV